MTSVSGCSACSAGAWINASNVVRLLSPKDPGLLETLFCMTAKYAVQTEGNHRIINPGVYTATGTWADRIFFPTGVFVSHYA